jgi:ribosomal protein S27AE
MNTSSERAVSRPELVAGPRFCPRCGLDGGDDADRGDLCPRCGEALVPKGYCAVCEDFWPLPARSPCPKHEVPLDANAPHPPAEIGTSPAARWVTVTTVADAMQAEAPRIRLEAEGIPTFLEGERMGSRSMYPVATGGVKLQVPEPFVPDARILLAQSWSTPHADDDLDDAWDELGPEPGAAHRTLLRGLIVLSLLGNLIGLAYLVLRSW